MRTWASGAVGRDACPANAGIVKGFSLVVWGDDQSAVPIALLHRDFVAEGADQLVDRRGRQAAKLDRGTVAADRLDPHRLLFA